MSEQQQQQGQEQPTPEGAAIELAKTNALSPAGEALRAQQIAIVQARVMQAIARPRDTQTFRVRILKECDRPGFADAAIYSKPVGGGNIEGLSIRFAEAALRLYGNLLVECQAVSSDDAGVLLRCTATDLETNSTDAQDLFVERTVERKDPAGRQVLKVRRNSNGKPTFTLEATDDEMLTKVNANASKLRRNRILAMMPADIIDEARDAAQRTCANRDAKDPMDAIKKLVDAFNTIGVLPNEVKEYLGHDIERVTPAEIGQLRSVFNAVRGGESTWREVMEAKFGKPPAAKEEGKGGTKSERMVEDLKDKKK